MKSGGIATVKKLVVIVMDKLDETSHIRSVISVIVWIISAKILQKKKQKTKEAKSTILNMKLYVN